MENNQIRSNRSFKIVLVAGALIAGTHLIGSIAPAPNAAAEWAASSSEVATDQQAGTVNGDQDAEQGGWTFKLLNLPIN